MNVEHNSASFLEVGRIGKPHGVRGDVFVSFTSDVEQRHQVGAQLWLNDDGHGEPLVIESVRAQKDRFVIHFVGVNDRDDAIKLTNSFLYGAPQESDEEGLWVHELIGSQVVDRKGEPWGVCVSVVHNPAHDMLELVGSILVPMPFVVSCDGTTTVIDPPEGLREALQSE